MNNYRVYWAIDIEAENHEDAARQALEIQRDPDSIANVFDVIQRSGVSMQIDLTAIGEERSA